MDMNREYNSAVSAKSNPECRHCNQPVARKLKREKHLENKLKRQTEQAWNILHGQEMSATQPENCEERELSAIKTGIHTVQISHTPFEIFMDS